MGGWGWGGGGGWGVGSVFPWDLILKITRIHMNGVRKGCYWMGSIRRERKWPQVISGLEMSQGVRFILDYSKGGITSLVLYLRRSEPARTKFKTVACSVTRFIILLEKQIGK